MRTEARFPGIPQGRGHYESLYLKAAPREGGRAIWIRHTAHRRPGNPLTCAIWLTWFDAGRGAPLALKQQFGEAELSAPDGSYIRVDGAEMGPGWARGALTVPATGSAPPPSASWDLRFDDLHESLRHLPKERMYDAALPRTKVLSPHPGALFTGELTIDGERVELDRWPGMVGHNWGSEHAHTWTWLHGGGLGGDGDGFFDLASARIKLGPLTTPWLGNGMLALDGERIRLGGMRRRAVTIDARPGRCEFTAQGEGGVRVTGTALAPPELTVGWEYSDPAGGTHDSINSSVADLELLVSRPSRPDETLRVERAAVYELGTGDRGHGIPIQPFADG